MPRVDLIVETPTSRSARAQQLEGMFDVPHVDVSRVEWHGEIPFDDEPWNVGLIVGPSGSGKTSIARQLFGDRLDRKFEWSKKAVIDDIAPGKGIEDVTNACMAVGFNTVPAWLRPFAVLSNGEQFRATIARTMLEEDDIIVVDEFTSVVDRQVAKIVAHAVQKHIRKQQRQFVAVSCHSDIVDWLQPDWIFEPATMTFSRRSVQPRPRLEVAIRNAPYDAWGLFAPYHYLTREMHKAARCFVLTVDDEPVSFAGVLHRPHPKQNDIKGFTRGVTLPDWQGLGLAYVLMDTVASAYKAIGYRMHLYPAHPSFIRSADRSPVWTMLKKPGTFTNKSKPGAMDFGGRANAVFEYVGPAMDYDEATAMLDGVRIERRT